MILLGRSRNSWEHFNGYKEFFDPSRNTMWKYFVTDSPAGKFKFGSFLTWLSKTPLSSHLALLRDQWSANDAGQTRPEHTVNYGYQTLVDKIFQEPYRPYMFAFMSISLEAHGLNMAYGYDVAHVSINYPEIRANFSDDDFYWNTLSFKYKRNSSGAWELDGTLRDQKAKIKTIKDAFDSDAINNFHLRINQMPNWLSRGSVGFWWYALSFGCNIQTYFKGETGYTPEQIYTKQVRAENVRISAEYDNECRFEVKLASAVTWESRSELYQVFNYSTRVTDYLEWPRHTTKRDEHKTKYGVELELCTDYPVSDLINAQDPELFAFYKQDSSVSGSKRYKSEMVTIPATLSYHKLAWARWFSKLDINHFDTTRRTGNGMHIHVSDTVFRTANHKRHFAWFVGNPANLSFLHEISEREKMSEYQHYAQIPTFAGRGLTLAKSYKDSMKYFQAIGRHAAVNITKRHGTVELRIFKGVVSFSSVIKNLEFCDALINFTGSTSYTANTVPGFLDYIKGTPKSQYKILKAYLKTINKKKVRAEAELSKIMFRENDPRKIIEVLAARGIEPSKDICAFINKKVKADAVGLSDDNPPKFKLLYHIGGRLADKDTELYKRYIKTPAQPILPPTVAPEGEAILGATVRTMTRTLDVAGRYSWTPVAPAPTSLSEELNSPFTSWDDPEDNDDYPDPEPDYSESEEEGDDI